MQSWNRCLWLQICSVKTNQADPNKAFHLIQAFAPGEVSYKEAHQIGVELANKLLEGKFSYIVSTHIDKGHVHNHIIFCAADNVNHENIMTVNRPTTTFAAWMMSCVPSISYPSFLPQTSVVKVIKNGHPAEMAPRGKSSSSRTLMKQFKTLIHMNSAWSWYGQKVMKSKAKPLEETP